MDFLKNLKNNILRKTYNQQGVKERETPYGYVDCKRIKDGIRGGTRTRTPQREMNFKFIAAAITPPGHLCSIFNSTRSTFVCYIHNISHIFEISSGFIEKFQKILFSKRLASKFENCKRKEEAIKTYLQENW